MRVSSRPVHCLQMPIPSDITLDSASSQASAVARGDISAAELLQAVLARFERFNDDVNAVVFTRLEEAAIRANEADAATARGETWGPLHGVPMTVKEPWDWMGSPSTSGYEELAGWRPSANSVVTQRLLDAGAVIYGKTNIPVGMADWQTFNPLYGTTSNPWDLSRILGGSSGGAAAAVATGMTALEIGSDIGASIRNPAHYCGVFGHKPTYGIIPTAGHGSPGDPSEIDIGVAGPLARFADDLSLGLDVVAGPGRLDGVGWRLELPAPRKDRPDSIKAAVMLESPCVVQDDELTDQLASTVEALGELGVQLDYEARPDIDREESFETYLTLLRAATGTEYTSEELDLLRLDATRFATAERYRGRSGDYRALVGHAATISHWEWAANHRRREHHRLAWAEFFDEYDVMLCPAAATAAHPHDQLGERADRTIAVNGTEQSTIDQLFWAGWSCGVYLPSTVAPAGLTASGLPCGLQIITGHLRDREGIAFARLMERELGGYQVPPGYQALDIAPVS